MEAICVESKKPRFGFARAPIRIISAQGLFASYHNLARGRLTLPSHIMTGEHWLDKYCFGFKGRSLVGTKTMVCFAFYAKHILSLVECIGNAVIQVTGFRLSRQPTTSTRNHPSIHTHIHTPPPKHLQKRKRKIGARLPSQLRATHRPAKHRGHTKGPFLWNPGQKLTLWCWEIVQPRQLNAPNDRDYTNVLFSWWCAPRVNCRCVSSRTAVPGSWNEGAQTN